MTDRALVSVAQFCDNRFNIVFTKNNVFVLSQEKVILVGVRAQPRDIWFINLKHSQRAPSSLDLSSTTSITHAVLHYAHTIKSTKNLIKFYHRCCYSPVISTWKAAIRKYCFATWPSLTCFDVDKYLDKSIVTIKGHLRQTQQGVRSTQPILVDESHPLMEMKTRETYLKNKPVGTVYTDQTGNFPYVSRNGSKYITIMYDYDCNAIMSTPSRSKVGLEQLSSLKKLHDNLSKQGQDTTVNFMNNEAPKCVTNYLVDNKISYQLVPSHVHHRNAVERAQSIS